MMRVHLPAAWLVACATTLGASGTAHAGSILSVNVSVLPTFSTGVIGPVGNSPAPNNDNATGPSPNVLPYFVFFNSVGLMDVEFNVASSGGTTEYQAVQTFINNSQATWTSFKIELGFGTGASFVRSGALDGLDFDAPTGDPAPFSPAFALIDQRSDILQWAGSVPSIGAAPFEFSIDVPDNLATFNPQGESRFTLRQTMNAPFENAVPEPAAAGLLVLGVLAVRRAALRASSTLRRRVARQ